MGKSDSGLITISFAASRILFQHRTFASDAATQKLLYKVKDARGIFNLVFDGKYNPQICSLCPGTAVQQDAVPTYKAFSMVYEALACTYKDILYLGLNSQVFLSSRSRKKVSYFSAAGK